MSAATSGGTSCTQPQRGGWRRRAVRFVAAASFTLLVAAAVLDRLFPLPLPKGEGGSTVVLARDGTPLRAFADAQGVWRYPTTAKQVSPLYLQALFAYEDRWFWRHPGVNPWALARGAFGGLLHGHVVSGGSTLTMQVARIIEPIPHTFGGKLVQILRALQLEAHLSKAQILDLYLDRAPFGGNIEGVEAASWAYLGKSAAHLSRAEAALLAVLPQAPGRLRPDRHPELARAARDKVLRRLRHAQVWSAAQVRAAMVEPVSARSLRAPMTAALFAQRMHDQQPEARRIATLIDADMQRAAEQRVADYLARLPPHSSVAVLAVENATLATRVYIGTGAFADPARAGHVDMVRAPRSPGSTLKPFLYGLALDDGLITSQSLLVDAPEDFHGYRPGNFDEAFNGPVSVAEALQRSLNVPAVDVLDHVGPNRFAARLASGGVDLELPDGAQPNLSIILGGAATRLESLVGAYTAFANAGIAGVPRYMPEQDARRRRLLSPGAAWIVRDILSSNPADVEGAPIAGTTDHADLAWKTGTSYGYRDAWAIGVEDRWTIGVWIGRPDGTPSPGEYGAVTALPLLFQIADMVPSRGGVRQPKPASVRMVDVCWPLGGTAANTEPALCRQLRHAWVLNDALPPTFPDRGPDAWSDSRVVLRVNADGRRLSAGCHGKGEHAMTIARWPALVTPWLGEDDRERERLPPLAPGCMPDALQDTEAIRITGLNDGTVLRPAPNSDKPLRVTLHAIGAQSDVQWLVDGRLLASAPESAAVTLDLGLPGPHRLTAVTRDGAWDSVGFSVTNN
ncbi:MAG TPA: penicillin-binding protein 1C [Rhodanobacteraceae bacterium]|nr:penicillin-binding protein 1C [Rhodanobacteraceae bacterium]